MDFASSSAAVSVTVTTSPAASPSIPSMKLVTLIAQTMANPASAVPNIPSECTSWPVVRDGIPPSHQSAHAAAATCAASRVDALRLRRSSRQPTTATRIPPPRMAQLSPRPSTPVSHRIATLNNTTTTMASPPPLGVGDVCELRSLGTSSTDRATAMRRASPVRSSAPTNAGTAAMSGLTRHPAFGTRPRWRRAPGRACRAGESRRRWKASSCPPPASPRPGRGSRW